MYSTYQKGELSLSWAAVIVGVLTLVAPTPEKEGHPSVRDKAIEKRFNADW